MSDGSNPIARWVHGAVIDWTLRLTRSLPGPIAKDRFDEIVSDLWEQEHAAGGSATGRAVAILVRWLRGVPADLAWRREVLAEQPVPAASARAWVPLGPAGKPFDQTNGAVDLDAELVRTDDGAELRDLVLKGAAANAAFGFFGGGTGI